MPMYEFYCDNCKKVHEVIQKFSDEPMLECLDCKRPVVKLLSQNSFSLKGGGWVNPGMPKKSTK